MPKRKEPASQTSLLNFFGVARSAPVDKRFHGEVNETEKETRVTEAEPSSCSSNTVEVLEELEVHTMVASVSNLQSAFDDADDVISADPNDIETTVDVDWPEVWSKKQREEFKSKYSWLCAKDRKLGKIRHNNFLCKVNRNF